MMSHPDIRTKIHFKQAGVIPDKVVVINAKVTYQDKPLSQAALAQNR